MLSRKRLLSSTTSNSTCKRFQSESGTATHEVDEVTQALDRVRKLFPVKDFLDNLPAIIWRQQVYAACDDFSRTDIDRKLNDLAQEGVIRFVKLGSTISRHDTVIVFFQELRTILSKKINDDLVERFLDALENIPEPVITREHLSKFDDDDIQKLISFGILATNRTLGSWLLSIPGAGIFVKSFNQGKNILIRTIRTTRFGEMAIRDLEKRKLPKNVRLSCEYLILEMIGSESVSKIESPTGPIVRLT